MFLADIKGDDVWGLAKIYDMAAVSAILSKIVNVILVLCFNGVLRLIMN